MGIISSIADVFRKKPSASPTKVDKYHVLEPLMSTQTMIEGAASLIKHMADNSNLVSIVQGRVKSDSQYAHKALEAYKTFVRSLAPHEQAMERQSPFSSIIAALTNVEGNLELIEDNFQSLFGEVLTGDETSIRTSSLFVIGYTEQVYTLGAWANGVATVLTSPEEQITPYQINEISVDARAVATFVSDNLNKWNPRYKGLLDDIKKMQNKGADVTIKSGETWMDDIVSDTQFSDGELDLMTAALKSPVLMMMTKDLNRYKNRLELLENKKNWLISRLAYVEAQSAGLEVDSPEYKRLRKAVDYYAAKVSEYEQKIERKRAA